MFEDALFATNRRRTPQQRWAAAMSFILQAAFVTVIVALPLFFTEALPLDYVRSFVELPSVPRSPGPPATQTVRQIRPQQSTSEFQGRDLVFHQPAKGPLTRIVDSEAPVPPCVGTCVVGSPGPGNGNDNNLITNLLGPTTTVGPLLPKLHPARVVRTSIMAEGLLIHKVTPVYPQLAIMTGQQGTVLMHAIIARDGSIQQLQVISGPALLIQAATDAVRQWRYRPYILNGDPVEVDTQITVNFKLDR